MADEKKLLTPDDVKPETRREVGEIYTKYLNETVQVLADLFQRNEGVDREIAEGSARGVMLNMAMQMVSHLAEGLARKMVEESAQRAGVSLTDDDDDADVLPFQRKPTKKSYLN